VAVAFPCGQSRVFQRTNRHKTPLCPPHSQKWLTPYLAVGLHTLKKGKPNLQNQTKEKLLTQFVLLLPARHPKVKREIVI